MLLFKIKTIIFIIFFSSILYQVDNLRFGSLLQNRTNALTNASNFISEIETNDLPGQTVLYRIRTVLGNTQIYMRYLTLLNHVFVSNGDYIQGADKFNYLQYSKAYMKVLKNYVMILFKDSNLQTYRLLYGKRPYQFISKQIFPQYFDGIYSKKFDVFYSKNQNNVIKLFTNFEANTPIDLGVSVTENYQMEFLFALKESKFITLFQDSNFIKIRQMINITQISNNFSSFITIQLPYSGFQCFCLNYIENTLFILDKSGYLVEISLLTNSVTKTTNINLMNQTKCFYSNNGSQYLVILKENNNLVAPSTIFSYYSLINQTLQLNYEQAPLAFATVSSDKKYIHISTQIYYTLSTILNQECPSIGYYYNASAFKCQNCSSNCQYCSSFINCTQCISGFFLNSISKACYICYSGTYHNLSTQSCQFCLENCIDCQNQTSCNTCAAGYILNQGLKSSCQKKEETSQLMPYNAQQAINFALNNSIIDFTNTFPSSRQIYYYFYIYFSNFDDFYLYSFHQRDYGQIMKVFFQSINSLQNKKWDFLGHYGKRSTIQNSLNLNETTLMKYLDRKQAYSGVSFVNYQEKGQNLFANCWYYLTFNLILVILLFLIMNIIFKILYNYRISRLVRPYSFVGYIGIIMLDGNMQIMFFLMFSQSQLLFSFDFSDKVLNTISNFIFFIFLIFSIGCYFMYFVIYKKLAKYFLDNSKCSINGIFVLVICSTLRQLMSSAIHNFLRNDYETQLLLLAAVEIFNIFMGIVFHYLDNAYIKLQIMWVSITFSFLRVIFNICLYFQQKTYDNLDVSQLFQNILQVLIVLYIFLYFFSIFLNALVDLIQGILGLFKKKKQQNNQQQKKAISQPQSKSIPKSKSKSKPKLKLLSKEKENEKTVQKQIQSEEKQKRRQELKIKGYVNNKQKNIFFSKFSPKVNEWQIQHQGQEDKYNIKNDHYGNVKFKKAKQIHSSPTKQNNNLHIIEKHDLKIKKKHPFNPIYLQNLS